MRPFDSRHLPRRRLTVDLPSLTIALRLHYNCSNGTMFPSPIGMGCSFNPGLIHQAAQHVACESNSLGISHIFAPVLDLALEQRFGRVEEGRSNSNFSPAFSTTLKPIALQLSVRTGSSRPSSARLSSTASRQRRAPSPGRAPPRASTTPLSGRRRTVSISRRSRAGFGSCEWSTYGHSTTLAWTVSVTQLCSQCRAFS